MKIGVYVIQDTKLNRYNLPFFARNDDEAKIILVRSNLPKSIYEDTKLFRIGSFDDSVDSNPFIQEDIVELQMLPYPNRGGGDIVMEFRTSFSKRVREHCAAGDPEIPVFEYDEKGVLVDTGKKKNIDKEIQSHKDEVLLSKIIERCGLTGETLLAPAECFGDATVLPKDLLDAKQKAARVQSFVNTLSDDELKILNEQGFDALVIARLSKKSESPTSEKSEVKDE